MHNMKAPNPLIRYLFLLLVFNFFVSSTIAQVDDLDVGNAEWKPGFIVLKKNLKDTLQGFLSIEQEPIGYIDKVKFRPDKLKKGTLPLVLIEAKAKSDFENVLSYKVNDRNKEHFIKLIADDPELAKIVSDGAVYIKDVERYAKEYNKRQQAKSN